MDIRDILDPATARPADKVALRHADNAYTYRALTEEVARLAHGLTERLRAGELLAIWLPNGPEILCLYLACLRTGIVPMPMHLGMTWPEVENILAYSGARMLVTSGKVIGPAGPDFSGTAVEQVYLTGAEEPSPPHRAYRELLGTPAAGTPIRPDAERPAFVLHTSGSEGRPKGVMLSYRNLNHILDFRLTHTRLGPDSVSVVASCLTQSVGLHQSLALLAAGATLVLLDSYDIERMAAALRRYRPTHLIMVVDAFDRLLHHPALDEACLRDTVFAAVGADRVTARVQDRFVELTGHPLHVSYGMTESSWAIVNLDGRLDKRLALGKPGPDIEIRLVDRLGRAVPDGAVGEIRIRSPRTMLGYLHDPELTRAMLEDGWLASGDLAYRDGDGYYWFAGRVKNLIVLSSGDNVSPVEVEQAILGHAMVSQCLVRAAEAADGSEVPWAFVVRSDDRLTEADLAAFLANRLSAFKIPRRFQFVAELPVGLTGKIRRTCQAPDDSADPPPTGSN